MDPPLPPQDFPPLSHPTAKLPLSQLNWSTVVSPESLSSKDLPIYLRQEQDEVVVFHKAKTDAVAEQWNLSLVGFSVGRRPYYEALLVAMRKTWKLQGYGRRKTLYCTCSSSMASRSRAMQLQCMSSISCFHRSYLTNAIPSDLKRRFWFTFGRTLRFCNFLFFRFLNRHFQSNHMSTQKVLDEVSGHRELWIPDRLKFLKMVSALSGYNNIEDFIEEEREREESVDMNDMNEEFGFALATARFPCITVGDSSRIELYDEVQWKNSQLRLLISETSRYFPDSATRKRAQEANEFSDACHFLRPQLPSIISNEQCCSILFHDSVALDADSGTESVKKFSDNESCVIAESKALNTEVYNESILDSAVRFIPDTTRRQCRRLEECGFHTVRKLLHHFPRTYADLQNAPGKIDDGAYQIFVGTVSASRALRASSSLSFLDVVVSCEAFDDHGISKKNIYLHLKKFFSGVRFTYQPFLRSLQSKYELGAHVYVCGKVKKMRCEDHYEMREYYIDVLKEEEQNAQVYKRPYPLYPSKAGLKPSFLKDTISRKHIIMVNGGAPSTLFVAIYYYVEECMLVRQAHMKGERLYQQGVDSCSSNCRRNL